MNPILNDPKLYDALLQIDKELAAKTRADGCPHCGGVLHSAVYPRKLKALPIQIGDSEIVRFSFCCSTDGCRSRITPHSVRFMGRKRYISVLVVLYSAMANGLTQKCITELSKLVGVSLRTLSRWQTWWQTTFTHSRFWQWNKALIMPPMDPVQLCKELVERFSAQRECTGMINLLRFISPLSSPHTMRDLSA
jgi:hypothetical protein